MGRVRASIAIAALASEAEALWYDTTRWPTFIDGLHHVARLEGDWPGAGARVLWDSKPGGRGRVQERVTAYTAREGQTLDVIKREMRETTGDLLERRIAQSLAPALGARADVVAVQDDQGAMAWRRVLVADGIEIHVRDDSPASRDDAVVAMREAVRAALGRADIRS